MHRSGLNSVILLLTLLTLLPFRPCSGDCAAKIDSCTDGAKCDTKNCLPFSAWCTAAATESTLGVEKAPSCWLGKPQDDASCASFTWRDPDIAMEFHFIQARADWIEAERICQKLGYNLLSIRSEKEKSAIEAFLSKIPEQKTGKIESFLDERKDAEKICDPHGSLDRFEPGYFWLGLHYDQVQKKWLHTDGSDPYDGWRPDSISDRLSYQLQKSGPQARFAGYMKKIVAYKSLRFERFDRRGWRDHTAYRTQEHHPQILCSRRTDQNVTKYIDLAEDTICLRGFKCNGEDRCILGPNWMDSQLCDGRKDCSDGSDESIDKCETFRTTLNKGDGRAWILFPTIRRDPKAAARFCTSKGLHLPSIRNATQTDILMNLPKDFLETVVSNRVDSFSNEFGDWASLISNGEWHILLGVDGKAGKEKTWSHGGEAVDTTLLAMSDDKQKELNETAISIDPEKMSEKILVVSNKRGVEIAANFIEQYFVVCEDSAAKWLPSLVLLLAFTCIFTLWS